MKTLISMEMSQEEAQEQAKPADDDLPKYPWGLSLNLDEEAMQKLGIRDLKVGAEVTILARATCTSASSYQTQGGEAESNCGLQITDMEIGDVPTDAAKTLYGGK